MTKDRVVEILLEARAVAVVRMTDAARLASVIEALRRGGLRAIEITMTVPGAIDIIREMAGAKPAGHVVGAGTVLNAETALAAAAAGADFVVSPVTDGDMVRACAAAGVCVAPGAFTPTEIVAASRAGADIVKVFPATSLGPRFFRDIRGPLPHVRLMPTGGVTIENARDFLAAGASCVGLGGALIDKAAVAAGDWDGLAERARRLTASIGSAAAG